MFTQKHELEYQISQQRQREAETRPVFTRNAPQIPVSWCLVERDGDGSAKVGVGVAPRLPLGHATPWVFGGIIGGWIQKSKNHE